MRPFQLAIATRARREERTTSLLQNSSGLPRLEAVLEASVSDWVLTPTTMPWGNRAMLFRDPDGNLINFFCRPERAGQ
jgi:hypothetical protein